MSEPTRLTVIGVPLRVARAIVMVVVLLDLAALAGFAFHTTTSVTRTVTPIAAAVPVTPAAPVTTGSGVGDGGGGAPLVVPVSNSQPASHPIAPTDKPPPPRHTKTHPPAKPPKHALPPVPKTPVGKCPVKLAEPKHAGGVQSLVPMAPAFGPFSAEAFAAASAYQPELELLGPILAQYPKFAPKVAPAMTPLLKLFGMGSNKLFGVISPLYSPHRPEVLRAETKLAAVFAPYSQRLVSQPMAGCVVDLEAALVGDTKS